MIFGRPRGSSLGPRSICQVDNGYRCAFDFDDRARMIADFEAEGIDVGLIGNKSESVAIANSPRYRGSILFELVPVAYCSQRINLAACLLRQFGQSSGIDVVVLPPFAWMAKRAERREPIGWTPIRGARQHASPRSQY